MIEVTNEVFEEMVQLAVDSIPRRFADHLNNVAFLTQDAPSAEQSRLSGYLHGRSVLLGLYQGIPLPKRGAGYNMVTPDVITIFKRAHEAVFSDLKSLSAGVHQTVWHEVAHYFGLDHGQIRVLEER